MGVLSENAIIGASAAVGGYDIDYSCRFTKGSSAYLSRTPGSTSNRKTWTWSGWAKRGTLADRVDLFGTVSTNGAGSAGEREFRLCWTDADIIQIGSDDGSYLRMDTTPVYRDPSAWYHIVVAMDTTQATNTNRMKLYVNNEQVTALGTTNYPAQNLDTAVNYTHVHDVGGSGTLSDTFDGYLADVNFIDGLALTPASFGELDEDTNEWKAKKYGGAYGTNGFFLEFKEGGMITYDREAEIAVTSSFTWAFSSSGNTSGEDLVNGLLTNNDAGGGWLPAGNAADRWIKFDFVTGKTYKACQWISINSSGSEGTWKWQGSNDDAAWTDIGGTFTLGGSDGGSNVTYNLGGTLNANTTSYRYYRILGISGTVNTSGRRLAMYFSESVPGLGNDNSGNGNNYTPTNLTATDQMIDTPQNSTGGNFCTINPNDSTAVTTLSEGNLQAYATTWETRNNTTFNAPTSGKWYMEVCGILGTYGNYAFGAGNPTTDPSWTKPVGYAVGSDYALDWGLWGDSGTMVTYEGGSQVKSLATKGWAGSNAGTVIGVAYDADNNGLWFSRDGVWIDASGSGGSANSATVLAEVGTSGTTYRMISHARIGSANMMFSCSSSRSNVTAKIGLNFGQDSSFAGTKTPASNKDSNDFGEFLYPVPDGFLALCTDNLPDPSIALPTDNFNTVLYTGTGSELAVTGVGFQPDFTWIKTRTLTYNHRVFDVARGVTRELYPNDTDAEVTNDAQTLKSFDSDGFTLGTSSGVNPTSTMVSWNWKAGGAAVSNTDGTITTSVSANTTVGFSIGTSTVGSTGTYTFGHGLSTTPELIIMKGMSGINSWQTQDATNGATKTMLLDGTNAAYTSGAWGSTSPTASVFTANIAAGTYVAYCFHSIEGFSKIGKYASNNSTNGPFLYLGFTPAFIMLKCYDATDNWNLYDNKRNGFNGTGGTYQLRADANAAGFTSAATMVDLVSNGMKIRTNDPGTNGSGRNYIYIAFAENPFKTTRAR